VGHRVPGRILRRMSAMGQVWEPVGQHLCETLEAKHGLRVGVPTRADGVTYSAV
jgi:hypothetical protein